MEQYGMHKRILGLLPSHWVTGSTDSESIPPTLTHQCDAPALISNANTNEVILYQCPSLPSSCAQSIHTLICCVQQTREFLERKQHLKMEKVLHLSTALVLVQLRTRSIVPVTRRKVTATAHNDKTRG